MIFLKKFLSAAVFAAAIGLTICSCSHKSSTTYYVPKSKVETTSQPFTEREVRAAEGTYFFDKIHIFYNSSSCFGTVFVRLCIKKGHR